MRAVLAIASSAVLAIACGGAEPAEAPVRHSLAPATVPVGSDAAEPNLFTSSDGSVVMSWIERVDARTHALRFAIRGTDGSWSEPRDIVRRDDLFVNWADFPSVVQLGDGRLLAHWLQRNGMGRVAYEVRLAESRDGGATWSAAVAPHRRGVAAEHGFVSMIVGDSSATVFFLDGGNNAAQGGHSHDGDSHAIPMSLASNVWGASSTPMRVDAKQVLDSRVCDCCQTSAAMTSRGPVVVYRDRSDSKPEIRDVVISRLVDGAWTAAQPVHADNWEVDFCPVNGPMVQADGDTVVVAWFTAARDTAKVQVAFSYDAGASFGEPVRVDDGDPAGRVGLQLLDGAAYVSWLERGTGDTAFVKLRRVQRDGRADDAVVISRSSGARSSGFPRITRLPDGLFLAWTEPGSPSVVKAATYTRSE